MSESGGKSGVESLVGRILDYLTITAIIPALAVTMIGAFIIELSRGLARNPTVSLGDNVTGAVSVLPT